MARDLREGDSLGRYVLEAAIDRGAFGRVWRARDAQSGRKVAIKVLAEQADETHARARTDLERLAAAAARDSRHIVRVLESGHRPLPHIVMEFVDGTNLRQELSRSGPLPQEQVIRIALEIADALRALHRARIVHRDVKPANILLDQQGEVRLTDFGIAKILGYDDTVTLTQQNLLSAPYAAPEVWEGAPTPSSDLYAFGAVLFEMLAGRPPFEGSLMELFRQHRAEEADFSLLPEDTAPSLRQLIYVCLRKAPADRPSGAEACFRLLERAREELRREPERFGPWVRFEHHEDRPWTWRCRHEKTGEEAVVEVHFAQDEAFGEALRTAVAANRKLVPLGAEKLLATNRLLLADDEGWPSAPDHNLVFWVARQEMELPETPAELDRVQLLRATEAFLRIIDVASAAGVRLDISPANAAVDSEGRVLLKRPGLPPPAQVEPRLAAFILLRSLPLSPEAAEVAGRARDIRDLRERLLRPMASAAEMPPSVFAGRRALTFLGLGIAGIVLALVLGVVALAGGGGDSQAVVAPTETPSVTSPPCRPLTLPAGLAVAPEACSAAGTLTFETSPDCPRGQVCAVQTTPGGVVLQGNDQTIAFVDGNGDLTLARERDFASTRLVQDGRIREPAWSPDGRYLAYIVLKSSIDRVTTELWILDTKDLASSANIFTSSDGQATADWARRLISQPRWAEDGHKLYFLWEPATGPDEVWSVDLPWRSGSLDMRELRSWGGTPQNLGVSKADTLDAKTTRYESISVLADGSLAVEFCSTRDGACGLGRWDGESFTVVVPPVRGARWVSPVQSGDGFLALQPNGQDAVLMHIGPTGETAEVARVPASAGPPQIDPGQLSLTLSADGAWALVGSPAGLRLIQLADGDQTPLVEGRWAAWYAPPPATPRAALPPAAPFVTPAPSPSPAPTATIIPSGEADLTGELVPESCAIGRVLTIKVRNLGPSVVDRDVFIRVSTQSGTVQGLTNVGLVGLKPGEEREVKTNYTVAETAQTFIEYARDRRNDNNIVTCTPAR